LTESVKVPKGRRERGERIFADQSWSEARGVMDEIRGESIKKGGEGGGHPGGYYIATLDAT
jgi:hypothetical protein